MRGGACVVGGAWCAEVRASAAAFFQRRDKAISRLARRRSRRARYLLRRRRRRACARVRRRAAGRGRRAGGGRGGPTSRLYEATNHADVPSSDTASDAWSCARRSLPSDVDVSVSSVVVVPACGSKRSSSTPGCVFWIAMRLPGVTGSSNGPSSRCSLLLTRYVTSEREIISVARHTRLSLTSTIGP